MGGFHNLVPSVSPISIRNKTAVINMAIKRMLNKVHLLDVSYVTTYIFRSDR